VVDWVRHHLENSVLGNHISAAKEVHEYQFAPEELPEVVVDSATFYESLTGEKYVSEVVHVLGVGASLLDLAKISDTIDR